MISLFDEMLRLFSVLNPPLHEPVGKTVQFISARAGEGTSSIAREFARVAVLHSQRDVLLLDMNVDDEPGQYGFFAEPEQQEETGLLSDPVDLGVDPGALWRLSRDGRISEGSNLPRPAIMSFHRVGISKLLVSRFDREAINGYQVQVGNQPSFWDGLRRNISLTVVDAPPVSNGFDGIAVSGASDAVVLVVEAEATRTPVVEDLRDRLVDRGANLAGIVFNKRRMHIPQRIYRLL